MINKNQYKVRNVKKILHKVGKNWLVMSTALLGMVAGGAAAGTATHADTTPANANHSDGYVNHQVTQSAGSASPQLVHSDGTSLASASTGSSVASGSVSPSASRSTMSSVAPSASSQGNNVNSESIGLNHRALGAVPKSVTSTSSDSANYLNLNGFNSLVSQMVTDYFPYSEFSNYIKDCAYDITNNRNVNDFLSEAASQVDTCFLTAPHKDNYHLMQSIKDTIKSTLSSLGKSPEFSDEYSTLSEGAILPFLRNLGSITSDNLVGPLSSIASDTSVNAVKITGFGEIASDAKSLASNASLINEVHQHHINEFNNEASKINNRHFVSDTINAIVHLSSSQAKSFKSLCSDLTSYINSPDIGSFVDNTLSNSNLSVFTDSYAKDIRELLNLLNNSDVESLYKKDYDQFHENRGRDIQRLLVQDLANVAGNSNKVNVKKDLNDFNYSIFTWGLTNNVPWMKTIYNGINDYLSSLKSQKSTTSVSNNNVASGKANKPSNVPSSATSVNSKSNSLNSASMNSQNSTNSNQPSTKPSNASTAHSSSTNSGDKTKSASPSGNDHSTQPSNPAKPNGSSDDENDKPSTNPNGVSPSGNPKSVPSAGTGHSAKPSDSVKPNGSNGASPSGNPNSISPSSTGQNPSNPNGSSDVDSGGKYESASPSDSDNPTKSANPNPVKPNGSNDTSSGPSSDSNDSTPQTPSSDDNNPGSPSAPNYNGNNNTSVSSSNDDSNFASQSINNASTSSSAVQNSASSSAKSDVSSASNVNQLSVGQQVDYHGMKVTRKRPTYRWFEISKTCLAHNTLDSVGKVKDYGAVLSPGMKVRLDKIFKVNVGHRTVYRYEINISGHDYFVTGNHRFTNDAYYRASDFKGRRTHGRYGHRYFEAIVKKPFMVYDSSRFDKDNQLWKSRRGQLIDIKGVHKIGNVTRLALIDGTYITANREFLKLI